MFRKHGKADEVFIQRFREFDEARVYIEDLNHPNQEMVFSAIDYMVTHKEYFFLLKNIQKQIKEGTVPRNVIEYAFMNLKVCPKRKEEKRIYLDILKSDNPDYTEPVVEFLKACCQQLKDFNLQLIKEDEPVLRKTGIDILKHCPDKEIKKEITGLLKKEKNREVVEEGIEFLKLYGEKEDIPLLTELKKRFPGLGKKIEEAVKGI